jgi:hypothetical protein
MNQNLSTVSRFPSGRTDKGAPYEQTDGDQDKQLAEQMGTKPKGNHKGKPNEKGSDLGG